MTREQKIEFIRKRMGELGYNQRSLAIKAGLGEDVVRHFLSGTTKKLLSDNWEAILLIIGEPDTTSPTPIKGRVEAGYPIEAMEYNLGTCNYPNPNGNLFALVVSGSSMDKYVQDGDLVIVDPTQTDATLLNGKRIIAEQGGTCTLKRLELLEEGALLSPESHDPRFKPMLAKQGSGWRIIGRVINKMGLEDKD